LAFVIPGFSIGIGADSSEFLKALFRIETESKRTADSVSRGFSGLNTTVSALTNTLRGLAGAFTVDRLVDMGKRALDAAGGLKEISVQAGVTTRQLQVLQFAGVQSGVGIQEITTSLSQFGRRLGEAARENTALTKTLKEYGIAIKDGNLNTRSSYDVLGDLADVIQQTGSESEKLRIITEALGRGGAKLLPIFNEGREGLARFADTAERAGLILGDDFIDAADRASDAIATMQFAFGKGFQIGVVREFASAVDASTESINLAREAGEAFGTALGASFANALAIMKELVPVIELFPDTLGNTKREITAVVDTFQNWGLLAQDVETLNRNLEDTNKEISELSAKRAEAVSMLEAINQVPENTVLIQNMDRELALLEATKAGYIAQRQELENAALMQVNLATNINKTVSELSGLSTGLDAASPKLDTFAQSAAAAAREAAEFAQAQQKAAVLGMAEFEFQLEDPVRLGREEVAAHEKALEEKRRLSEQAARDQQRAAERAAREQAALVKSISFDVEADRRLRQFQSFKANAKRIAEEQRKEEQEARRGARDDQRQEEDEFASEITGIWEGVGQNIQSTFADTYEDIFRGGITNFQDLATTVEDIFIKAAANIAAAYTAQALFGGLSGAAGGLSGLFGPAAAGAAGAGRAGGSGVQSAGFTSIYGVTQRTAGGGIVGSGVSGQAALGYGAAGALGGSLLGPAIFGQGPGAQIGGAVGGAGGSIGGAVLGGIIAPGIGAPIGAALGGLLGGAGGGFLGSLFGGGSTGARRATIGGGPLGGTGTGAAAQLAAGIDQQIRQILTSTQETVVNAALATSEAITVEFNKQKGLSEGDKQRIASARLGPAAAALGITNVGAVTAGSAEQQMGQFQEALGAKQAIDDLRDSLTPFAAQWEDLNEQFAEVTATAQKYGISLAGVDVAQQLATEALARAQRQQAIAVSASVGAMDPLTANLQQLDVQMQEAAAQADLLGISTANLAETHQRAAIALVNAQRLQIHGLNEFIGNISPLQRALGDLQVQFENAWQEATALGLSTDNLTAAHQAAIRQVEKQFEAQQTVAQVQRESAEDLFKAAQQRRLETHALREQIGLWTPLTRTLSDLQVQFENAWHEADALGESTKQLTKAHEAAREAVIRQHQAQIDAMALSITNPFEQLMEPLRALGIELDRSLLNPLDQFNAAAQNFRDIAAQALAGNTTAIQQLDEAGQQFIATATSVGASPAQAAATREVQNVLQQVMGQVENAQAQASRGVEGAIWGANQRVVDSLAELIVVGRQQIEEMRRLQRGLT
jgi:hypothetical protein